MSSHTGIRNNGVKLEAAAQRPFMPTGPLPVNVHKSSLILIFTQLVNRRILPQLLDELQLCLLQDHCCLKRATDYSDFDLSSIFVSFHPS